MGVSGGVAGRLLGGWVVLQLAGCIAYPASDIADISHRMGEPGSGETLVITRREHGKQVVFSPEGPQSQFHL